MVPLHVYLHLSQDVLQLANVLDDLPDFLLVDHCFAELELDSWHVLVLCGRHVCQLNGVSFSVTNFI